MRGCDDPDVKRVRGDSFRDADDSLHFRWIPCGSEAFEYIEIAHFQSTRAGDTQDHGAYYSRDARVSQRGNYPQQDRRIPLNGVESCSLTERSG